MQIESAHLLGDFNYNWAELNYGQMCHDLLNEWRVT